MKENEKIEVQVLVHTEDACEKVKELIEELKKANSLADEMAKKKYRSHKGVIGTDTIKGFLTPGTMKIISAYADNEKYCQELRICLSLPDWYKFSKQEFYQQLIEYLHKIGIQENIENLDEEKG